MFQKAGGTKEREEKENFMDDGGSPNIGILVFVVLVVFDFVIFGFIAAMQNLNESAIEKLAEEGNKKAALLLKYADKSERYTHVCQFMILLAHMLVGFLHVPLWKKIFLSAGAVCEIFGPLSGEPQQVALSVLADIVIFMFLSLILLGVGVYTPEKVAARKPESWALALVRFVHGIEIVCFPMIWLTDALANLLARIFGVDPLSETDDVTEEEIISMINEGHEQGMLLASEAEMIHNIFEFGDKEAKDIMTHRKHITAIDGTKTFAETLAFIKETSHSRFPVYEDDIDNIVGVLHIKDALERVMDGDIYETPIKEIEDLVREVDFIPETRNINTLFAEMQGAKSHMVIVVDEYGQTAGIVAMEDILEEIVGNIEDEHDEEEPNIEWLSDHTWQMHGLAEYRDVLETLEVTDADEDEFETLNGFLISLIDKIPDDDEVFSTTAYGYLFEIQAVENKMIQKVLVTKLPEEDGAAENDRETCREEKSVVE